MKASKWKLDKADWDAFQDTSNVERVRLLAEHIVNEDEFNNKVQEGYRKQEEKECAMVG